MISVRTSSLCNSEFFIDKGDLEKIKPYKWYIEKGYVIASQEGGRIRLHRLITGVTKDKVIDHINGNTLDNRRFNLRICDINENVRNSKISKSNKSGLKGVSWYKTSNKWRASITMKSRTINLGHFKTKEEAAIVYDIWAIFYFGEFARTNKSLGLL